MPASGHLLANGFRAGRTWLFDLTQPARPEVITSFACPARFQAHLARLTTRQMGTNPCLPPRFAPRVGTRRNLRIHKHFVSAATASAT